MSTRESVRILEMDSVRIDGCWGPGPSLSLTEPTSDLVRVVDTEDGEPVEAELSEDGRSVTRADGEDWPEGDGTNDDNGRFHVAYRIGKTL